MGIQFKKLFQKNYLWPQTSNRPSGMLTNSPSFSHSIHSPFFPALASLLSEKIVIKTQLPYPNASKFIYLPLFVFRNSWMDVLFIDNSVDGLSIILKSVHQSVPWSQHTALAPPIIPSPLFIFISSTESYEYRNHNF